MAQQTPADRMRRKEFVADARGALHQNTSIEARTAKREKRSDEWTEWLHRKMSACGVEDPAALLPDALAKIEELIDDRIAEKLGELKKQMRKAFL